MTIRGTELSYIGESCWTNQSSLFGSQLWLQPSGVAAVLKFVRFVREGEGVGATLVWTKYDVIRAIIQCDRNSMVFLETPASSRQSVWQSYQARTIYIAPTSATLRCPYSVLANQQTISTRFPAYSCIDIRLSFIGLCPLFLQLPIAERLLAF